MSRKLSHNNAGPARSHIVLQAVKLTICVLWFLCGAQGFAQESQGARDSELLLQRIRNKMTTHLSKLRNYTCRVQVDRVVSSLSNNRLDHRDHVDLDVAFVGERELFSRPGEARFDEQSIGQIVPLGMIGDDAFGAHEESVVAGDSASFKFVGACRKDGHKTFRYNFRVPMESSLLYVKHGSAGVMAGFKGSFWVDTDTLDPVRMEWKTENLPASVEISSVQRSLHYKVLRIAGSDFLLPTSSELTSFDRSGTRRLNIVNIDRCMQFTGETVVTYGAPKDGGSMPRTGTDPPVH
jgi:hypothetical protein